MKEHQMLGYIPDHTFIHQLNATTKLLFFILLSVACMTTYDTRFLFFMSVCSLVLFKISHIRLRQVSFVLRFIAFFSLLNLVAVYLFSPEYGVSLYHSKTVIFEGIGRYSLTQEQLFYEFNLVLKYFSTIPLALLFILTTNPSELAASLNKIGISYKISYAVALAMRYIPDIQEDFFNISQAQQARGYEMSKKASLSKRIKGTAQIIMPLIFSSLDRIETISTAMELRRFGQKKTRSWYAAKSLQPKDLVVLAIGIGLTIISFSLFYVNGGRFYNPFH